MVHAHLYASAAAAAAAVPRDTPLVLTEHTEGPWRSWRVRAVSRWFYRRASRIVAVSTAIRNVLVDVYRVPPARIEVLPAIPAIPVRPRATQPGGGRSAVVGFAGRLIREKGVDVFLRAASLVAGVVPEARFVVIGDGRLRGELEALAGDLGLLEERVRFLGFRDDAADLIAGLDILAVPSRSEGTPLVVGEAMTAGVPVVVSRVGGLPDQVTHRRTGLVVDPEDPEGLAAALVSLLLAPDEARQFGEAGRAYAARFPHAALVDRMEEVYSEARPARKIRSGETRSAASKRGRRMWSRRLAEKSLGRLPRSPASHRRGPAARGGTRSLCARPRRSQSGVGPARRRFCGAGGITFPARARAAGITTSAPSEVRTAKEVESFSSRMPRTSAICSPSPGLGRRQRITTRWPTSAGVRRTSSR